MNDAGWPGSGSDALAVRPRTPLRDSSYADLMFRLSALESWPVGFIAAILGAMSFISNTHPSEGRPWVRASAVLIMIAVLTIWVWIEATPPERVPPAPGQAVAIDKSPTAQQQRKEVIDKLLADGLLRRIAVDAQGRVRASLRPGFYMLDEPTRRDYAQIIYAYHFDGSNVNDVVVLRDGRNGNEVGTYNPYRDGLSMYK